MEESTPGRFISLHGSILRALYRRRTRERITSVSAAWSTRQLQERSWRMRGCPQGNDGHSKRRSVSAEEFSNPGDLSRQLIAGNRKRFIRVDDVPTYVKKRFRIEADPSSGLGRIRVVGSNGIPITSSSSYPPKLLR